MLDARAVSLLKMMQRIVSACMTGVDGVYETVKQENVYACKHPFLRLTVGGQRHNSRKYICIECGALLRMEKEE